jgi:restriction system protein
MCAVTDVAPPTEEPIYRQLFWTTLHALQQLGGSGSRQEVAARAAEIGGYTEEQQADLMPNGRTPKIAYHVGWNLTRLKRIGLADNSQRGVWSLTERGRNATEQDIPALWAERAVAYRELRRQREGLSSARVGDAEDAISEDGDDGSWKDAVISRMKALQPDAFERLCQRLLREAGFEKVLVTGRSGDQGIDGVGLARLGLLSFPTYFQCKRYENSVGSGAVRDFRGAMAGRGEKGVIITTGTFTPAARQEATRDGVPPIDLIDGDAFCDLLKTHELGVVVRTRVVEDVSINAAFWDHHA